MTKYIEIVDLNSPKMKCSVESISRLLDRLHKDMPEVVEKEIRRQCGIFNDKHFDETTSKYVIDHMVPATKSMHELLEGITPSEARSRVQRAYSAARDHAMQQGFSAPELNSTFTDYDYYVVLAMCLADYWCSCMMNSDSVDMIAYEWMSDPDASVTKTWDYFFE